jgi:hypothetical protein
MCKHLNNTWILIEQMTEICGIVYAAITTISICQRFGCKESVWNWRVLFSMGNLALFWTVVLRMPISQIKLLKPLEMLYVSLSSFE